MFAWAGTGSTCQLLHERRALMSFCNTNLSSGSRCISVIAYTTDLLSPKLYIFYMLVMAMPTLSTSLPQTLDQLAVSGCMCLVDRLSIEFCCVSGTRFAIHLLLGPQHSCVCSGLATPLEARHHCKQQTAALIPLVDHQMACPASTSTCYLAQTPRMFSRHAIHALT